MAVCTMFGTGKKCAIWDFGFSRSPGNKYASMREVVNVMNIVYFYEIFFVLRKSSFPS